MTVIDLFVFKVTKSKKKQLEKIVRNKSEIKKILDSYTEFNSSEQHINIIRETLERIFEKDLFSQQDESYATVILRPDSGVISCLCNSLLALILQDIVKAKLIDHRVIEVRDAEAIT